MYIGKEDITVEKNFYFANYCLFLILWYIELINLVFIKKL